MSADAVVVEALGAPGSRGADFNFERFASVRIANSIVAASEASFELGNDGSFDAFSELVEIGALFRVFVNDRPRLSGRVETLNAPVDARQSTTQRFVVRTKMADAMYQSAPQGLRLKDASIKAFVLACYSAIGLVESDFDFRGDVSRDLLTGRTTRGGRAPPDLEPLKEDAAKVNPPETVFQAVDRHLRRHGLLHWDGPDGKIVVAAPDDEQVPLYLFQCIRGEGGQLNNCTVVERTQDVSGAPTALGIFGVGGKADFTKAKVRGIYQNDDLLRRGFTRSVVILDEGVKTIALASARARREASTRNRGLDRIRIETDGLSHFDGQTRIEYAPDTCGDMLIAQLGGALGTYLVESATLERNAREGDRCTLELVRKGIWRL